MSIPKALLTGLALATAPPAFAEASAAASLPNGGQASFERVGEALVDSIICEPFGYTVDRKGLAEWIDTQVNALADQNDGYDQSEAATRVNRAATSYYWFVRNRYDPALGLPTSSNFFYNPTRFALRYRKRCGKLATSNDVGRYFTPTGDEPDRLELVARVRGRLYSEPVRRAFARAYPPYLGDDPTRGG